MRPFYRLAYKIVEAFTLNMFHGRVEGLENVPAGPALVVSNHVSFLDPTTIGWALSREMYFLARKTLFKPPFLDKILPLCNSLPIDRDNADLPGLRRIINLLKDGEMVLLFPEGTRSPDGTLQAAESGAGFVAYKARVPILPVRIFGTYESLSRHQKKLTYNPLRIVVGKPFFLPKDGKPDKEAYQKLANRMMEEIGKLK
jgi:1-acyl-sn-glycerol-3-phosphate acyltransferase